MTLKLDDNYPEILASAANAAYAWLTKNLDLPHEAAADAAFAIAEAIRKDVGGSYEYIPKAQPWKLSKRDSEIYAKFNGANYRDLARQHHLSEIRIRQIVERERERRAQGRGK